MKIWKLQSVFVWKGLKARTWLICMISIVFIWGRTWWRLIEWPEHFPQKLRMCYIRKKKPLDTRTFLTSLVQTRIGYHKWRKPYIYIIEAKRLCLLFLFQARENQGTKRFLWKCIAFINHLHILGIGPELACNRRMKMTVVFPQHDEPPLQASSSPLSRMRLVHCLQIKLIPT